MRDTEGRPLATEGWIQYLEKDPQVTQPKVVPKGCKKMMKECLDSGVELPGSVSAPALLLASCDPGASFPSGFSFWFLILIKNIFIGV